MFSIIVAVAVIAVAYFILEWVIRSFKVDGFGQKYVFITGCDSGFGRRLAIRLDGLGFPVFAACLTEEGQKSLSENASSRLTTLSLDVTEAESIKKALDFVKEKLPQGSGLWALVNNAGIIGPVVPIEMCTMEGIYKTFAVNLFGTIQTCRQFLPLIRKSKGRVVNITSIAGRLACGNPSYNTSKYGLEGFTDSLRREVYDQGIKVSILEPGFFKTNLLGDIPEIRRNVSYYYNQADEEIQKTYGENFVEEYVEMMEESLPMGSANLDLVVNAFIHAIVSRFPKTRYVLGLDAVMFLLPLTYLPAGLADWVLISLKKKASEASKWRKARSGKSQVKGE